MIRSEIAGNRTDKAAVLPSRRISEVRRTEITVATWNVQWATSDGKRGSMVRQRLTDTAADVVVVTEGRRGILPDRGHTVDAGDDWGYGQQQDRRKVLLWSRWPLTDIERFTTGGGAGRVVTAVTAAPSGLAVRGRVMRRRKVRMRRW